MSKMNMFINCVSMHAATRRCGYPADSSDLATGSAGAATSTPSPLWRRSDRGCGSCSARSLPATRSAHPWRARATNTDSETYRRSGARQPGRHWAAGSGRPTQTNCDGPSLPPVRDSLSPRQAAGSAAHSVGSSQLCRSVHAHSL